MMRTITINGEKADELDLGDYAGPTEFFCFENDPPGLLSVIAEIVFGDASMGALAFSRDRRWVMGVSDHTTGKIEIGKVPASVAKTMRKLATGKDGSMQKPPKTPERERAALLLDSYISFRAKREGVSYGLDPLFFLGALDGGCREFFGVTVDRGELVNDNQFPAFFKEWKNHEHAH